MAETERQDENVFALAERDILEALAGVDALLAPANVSRTSPGLKMIVAEREVRVRARAAGDRLLALLAPDSLAHDQQRLGLALLHASHVIGAMCDECVDLSRLAALPGPDDNEVAAALASMRKLCRSQVRTAAKALAKRSEERAARLHPVHAEIEALNNEIGGHGRVAEDGAVGYQALGSAVLTAECLTRVSEQAVDIGDDVVLAVKGSARARQSPV